MRRIKGTTKVVKQVLEDMPFTRNSNDVLYVNVCRKLNPAICGQSFGYVMMMRSELKLPSYESVTRARRKLVNLFPELSGNDEVEEFREENEKIARKYAMSGGIF